jgi:heme exporter protein C
MLFSFIKTIGKFSTIDFIRNKFINFSIFFFIFSFLAGFLIIFFITPEDYLQGLSAKIMYIHVPSAWACSLIYLLMTILSLCFLIYRNKFCAILAYSLSISGAFFTLLAVITGMIWGKNTWGVYWAWDARLTSVLILLFFYIFHIGVFNSKNEEESKMKIISMINIIGAINIPVIKFSVEVWNSLHQPASIIRKSGISIDFSMFYPLLIFFLSFAFFTFIVTILKAHSILLEKKIHHLVKKDNIC